MTDVLRVVIETDRDGAESILSAPKSGISIERHGPPPAPQQQGLAGAHMLEPISMAVTVASVSGLAYRILEHWLRTKEYGVQIDARTQPATISTIAGVPSGFVVVIAVDGSVQNFQAPAMDGANFASLLNGVLKPTGGKV